MRKMPLMLLGAAAGAALTMLASHPGAVLARTGIEPAAGHESYRGLQLFGQVFDLVRAAYVDKPDDRKLIETAVNGMLTGLDPHSSYMDAKSFADMEVDTRGEFGGLGLEVTIEDGLVKVVAPIDDTPAARAGLMADDIITRIDAHPVKGLTVNQAVDRMRGPVKSRITLTIMRKGRAQPFDVTLLRDIIRVRSVRARKEGDDIGYVRISQFNAPTSDELKQALEDLAKQIPSRQLKGYVLDLRNNPGGLLDQAIAVSSDFLGKGEVVATRGRSEESDGRYFASGGDLIDDKPLIVLINGGSASAAEIVAGALQDHKRATVVGTRSFGKGSVQTIIPLGKDQGALRLTTARYFTPSGRSIQAQGITPDIEVLQDVPEALKASAEANGEASLPGHLKPTGEEHKGSQEYVPPDAKDDKALVMAEELLRGTVVNPKFPPKPAARSVVAK
ncbi:MAG: S41 family peptidase [Xanthobacteraceae bacterium]